MFISPPFPQSAVKTHAHTHTQNQVRSSFVHNMETLIVQTLLVQLHVFLFARIAQLVGVYTYLTTATCAFITMYVEHRVLMLYVCVAWHMEIRVRAPQTSVKRA